LEDELEHDKLQNSCTGGDFHAMFLLLVCHAQAYPAIYIAAYLIGIPARDAPLGGAHSRQVRHAVERIGKTVLKLLESEFIYIYVCVS